MKQVQYKDWLKEFKKLSKEYIEGIDWKTIIFEKEDFGVIGDDLQNMAYTNVHMSKFDDDDYDLTEWNDYDSSCADRTDFQIDLESKWEEELDLRNLNNG